MSSKKDFSEVNTGRVYDMISEATADPEAQQEQEQQQGRRTYTAEEVQEMREAGTTQGRKGCKAVRINMSFSPSVHAYIRTMARVRGESVSEFTEHVFRLSMEENKELYERAKNFKNAF